MRCNATLSAGTPDEVAAAAARWAELGFDTFKLKVGAGDDVAQVAAARSAVGPAARIRVDANGAWTVEEAAVRLGALAPAGIELAEEPVSGIEALRALRGRSPVALAMDETAAQPGAIASGATDLVCLKISSCGGISALLAKAALVRASGADVYLASTYDGPLGIAAAVHCAAALRPMAASGLGTLELFEDEFTVLSLDGGAIAVPTKPGLGV